MYAKIHQNTKGKGVCSTYQNLMSWPILLYHVSASSWTQYFDGLSFNYSLHLFPFYILSFTCFVCCDIHNDGYRKHATKQYQRYYLYKCVS